MFKQHFRFTWKDLALSAATGFGLGLSPVASGTFGALLGIPLMFALKPLWGAGVIWQVLCCAALAGLAIPLCSVAEKHFQKKDDRRIVADEYLTFPISMIGLPLCFPALLLAFLTNRALDIIKPFPACRAQILPGGLGIVLDDVISAAYSLALNHIFWILLKDLPF